MARPPRPQKRRQRFYPRAASKAERLGLPPISPTTANGYISKMSALFKWAARGGLGNAT